jgi:hypothetical protein
VWPPGSNREVRLCFLPQQKKYSETNRNIHFIHYQEDVDGDRDKYFSERKYKDRKRKERENEEVGEDGAGNELAGKNLKGSRKTKGPHFQPVVRVAIGENEVAHGIKSHLFCQTWSYFLFYHRYI